MSVLRAACCMLTGLQTLCFLYWPGLTGKAANSLHATPVAFGYRLANVGALTSILA